MDIVFERTGEASYAIEVRRPGAPPLRADPAPGFDPCFPHDLQHLIVEEQLGLTDGIFGRLARGGTASTFHLSAPTGPQNKRARSRQRRRLARREATLARGEANDFTLSEQATWVAWHDWLVHSPDPALRTQGYDMAETAEAILQRMEPADRDELVAALPRLRSRVAEVASAWSATPVGGSITITWTDPLR